MSTVSLEGVWKRFGEVVAVRDVDLNLPHGEGQGGQPHADGNGHGGQGPEFVAALAAAALLAGLQDGADSRG